MTNRHIDLIVELVAFFVVGDASLVEPFLGARSKLLSEALRSQDLDVLVDYLNYAFLVVCGLLAASKDLCSLLLGSELCLKVDVSRARQQAL